MLKGEFWLIVGVWYLLLGGIILAGVSRFGLDVIIRAFLHPSPKVLILWALLLVPLPFVVRQMKVR